MSVIGHVKEIWRYPVKSLRGESLHAARIWAKGVLGDRCWALKDEFEVCGARDAPVLLNCSSRYVGTPGEDRVAPVEVTFPDGTVLRDDARDIDARFSALTGKALKLWPLQPESDRDHYRRKPRTHEEMMAWAWQQFAREPGEPMPDLAQFPPELMEYFSFPGMYADALPLHILTTASLDHLAGRQPESNWDRRRFRPNLLIETAAGTTGLVENAWLGRTLVIGAARIACPAPTPRCGMTMQAQPGLPKDPRVLRTIVRDADQNLGVYGAPLAAGEIRVGDAVTLV